VLPDGSGNFPPLFPHGQGYSSQSGIYVSTLDVYFIGKFAFGLSSDPLGEGSMYLPQVNKWERDAKEQRVLR
jgi:hypothetical protein